MNSIYLPRRVGHWVPAFIGGALAISALVACSGSATPLAVSESVPTFAPTVTEAPSATPVPATATPNMKELFALHEAATEVALRTEVALTGVLQPRFLGHRRPIPAPRRRQTSASVAAR